MTRLGTHVVDCQLDDKPYLYHTVTKEYLPASATDQTLANHHFLAWQEADALRARLIRVGDNFAFSVIHTWQCDLRCSHCSVLQKLTTNEWIVDPIKAAAFIRRAVTAFRVANFRVHFVGGEP